MVPVGGCAEGFANLNADLDMSLPVFWASFVLEIQKVTCRDPLPPPNAFCPEGQRSHVPL